MVTIALEGMRFFAHHGVFDHERIQGNHFEVDVWLHCGDDALTDTDDIANARDYGKVYEVVAAIMGHPKNLLESIVNAIGATLMQEFPSVKTIVVRVSKHDPPVNGPCRRSYVEATFQP